ncbi:unnamed protein product [Candida verbasci]|uniref:ABC transporter domain-containing protein n=1 Tax=Candida verbasci TaxID=1227364 RepID=A0A9W4XFZ7_9ASCO|nr:unnamed protein product [Candida verbasci]
MGSSGSGKTTLLNTLSTRTNFKNKKLKYRGTIKYYSNVSRIKSSYLLQDDVFLPGLTCIETLQYQADLRLPSSVTKVEKRELIDSLLETLSIRHLENKIVSSFVHGTTLSGGEQRRLSLAIQLLNKPSVLFLDEPTTGLDSTISLQLVNLLKKLTTIGITIILSIHQPRSEISELFDKICVLAKGGRMIYYGTLIDSHAYFRNVLYLPEKGQSNFINFIVNMSVKNSSTKSKELFSAKRIDDLVMKWKQSLKWEEIPDEKFEILLKQFSRSKNINFLQELIIHTRRSVLLTWRDRWTLFSLNGGSILIAVVSGWMFYKPNPNLSGIRSITSVLYVMMEFIGFSPVFIEIERLWTNDGLNFIREYKEHNVGILTFIISRKLGKSLFEDLPIGAIFAAITYFMWGLRSGAGHFFIYFLLTILVSFIGMASGLICFAIGTDLATSTMYFNFFYQLQNLACGFFVNAKTMPVYVRWLKYLAYFWYTFGASTSNQFTNWMGNCPYEEDDARCEQYTGSYQLDLLGYPQGWIGEPIGILFAWLFGFYLLAWICLHLKNYDIKSTKTIKNTIGEEEEEEGREKEETPVDEKVTSDEGHVLTDDDDIYIHLDSINLKSKQNQILSNISTTFNANQVNAIMGSSGSGKSTLLKLLVNRLSTNIQWAGEIFLNSNQSIKPTELSKISSYLSQSDTSLIANLTVRESLYYQAKLRLPADDQDRIPIIINKLIRQYGLLDCADTIIGSEFTKGISGGEKRRLSIAIQLLSKPKILLLDEPTSGLDSFTALSILKLLQFIAKENKTTIILTIHQPNEEMLKEIDKILIISFGEIIFDGNSNQLNSYLYKLGYGYSNNPTNVILDNLKDLPVWTKDESTIPYGKSIDLERYHKHKVSSISILFTLTKRQFINTYRSFDILFTRYIQVIVLGGINALFFAPLRNNQEGISNRLGVIQEVLNLYFIGLINNITTYPLERQIFYQEYRDGLYGVFEFSLSYLINELPCEIIPTLCFSAFTVFAIGLPRNPAMFFAMFISSFIPINIGESLGILLLSIFDHLGLATNILAIIMTFAVFMAGTMSLQMPVFFRAWNWLNPLKYSVGICAKLGFKNQTFSCDGQFDCVLNSGEKVLEYYGLNHNLPVYFGALVACLFIYRIIAILILYIKVRLI